MADVKRVRIVKREERASGRPKTEPRPARPESGERETRNAVTEWVRDHRRRSEEFRVNYSPRPPLNGRRTGRSSWNFKKNDSPSPSTPGTDSFR
jgi:hypothetical protein